MTLREQASARLTDDVLTSASQVGRRAVVLRDDGDTQTFVSGHHAMREVVLDAIQPVLDALAEERDDLRAKLTQAEADNAAMRDRYQESIDRWNSARNLARAALDRG